MIGLDDPRWLGLEGGYRLSYDPRPALQKLAGGRDVNATWDELCGELYHQGDVGEASYLASAHVARIHVARGVADWNSYAFVAMIEEARHAGHNPKLPAWMAPSYFEGLKLLCDVGLKEFATAESRELINSIIAVLAFTKGEVLLGRFAISFTEDERKELFWKFDHGG